MPIIPGSLAIMTVSSMLGRAEQRRVACRVGEPHHVHLVGEDDVVRRPLRLEAGLRAWRMMPKPNLDTQKAFASALGVTPLSVQVVTPSRPTVKIWRLPPHAMIRICPSAPCAAPRSGSKTRHMR